MFAAKVLRVLGTELDHVTDCKLGDSVAKRIGRRTGRLVGEPVLSQLLVEHSGLLVQHLHLRKKLVLYLRRHHGLKLRLHRRMRWCR